MVDHNWVRQLKSVEGSCLVTRETGRVNNNPSLTCYLNHKVSFRAKLPNNLATSYHRNKASLNPSLLNFSSPRSASSHCLELNKLTVTKCKNSSLANECSSGSPLAKTLIWNNQKKRKRPLTSCNPWRNSN